MLQGAGQRRVRVRASAYAAFVRRYAADDESCERSSCEGRVCVRAAICPYPPCRYALLFVRYNHLDLLAPRSRRGASSALTGWTRSTCTDDVDLIGWDDGQLVMLFLCVVVVFFLRLN